MRNLVAIVLALSTATLCCACSARETGSADAGFDASTPPDAPAPIDAPMRDAELPDGACAAVRLATTRTTPNVFFVIDRSGSMLMPFSGSGSRWIAVQDALVGTPRGLVTTLEDQVRFGALMYSDDPDFAGCPDTTSTPAVIHGYGGVGSLYSSSSPGGNTPTGDAIDSLLMNLDTLMPMRAAGPSILVLATDGEPATCLDGTDIVGGRALVVDRVTAARALGIDTYVISVGVGVAMAHLQEVANAGLGLAPGAPDAPFWVATDVTGFEVALRTIVDAVLSCEVELAGSVVPARACRGTVTLGADTLTCDTDWRAVDATHIELLGAACDRLLHTADELVATFPCDVFI